MIENIIMVECVIFFVLLSLEHVLCSVVIITICCYLPTGKGPIQQ